MGPSAQRPKALKYPPASPARTGMEVCEQVGKNANAGALVDHIKPYRWMDGK